MLYCKNSAIGGPTRSRTTSSPPSGRTLSPCRQLIPPNSSCGFPLSSDSAYTTASPGRPSMNPYRPYTFKGIPRPGISLCYQPRFSNIPSHAPTAFVNFALFGARPALFSQNTPLRTTHLDPPSSFPPIPSPLRPMPHRRKQRRTTPSFDTTSNPLA